MRNAVLTIIASLLFLGCEATSVSVPGGASEGVSPASASLRSALLWGNFGTTILDPPSTNVEGTEILSDAQLGFAKARLAARSVDGSVALLRIEIDGATLSDSNVLSIGANENTFVQVGVCSFDRDGALAHDVNAASGTIVVQPGAAGTSMIDVNVNLSGGESAGARAVFNLVGRE